MRGKYLFQMQGQAGPGYYRVEAAIIPDTGTRGVRMSQSEDCHYSRYRDRQGQDFKEQGLPSF